jgi:hypothetical protein
VLRSERSEASVAARGAGYPENGRASSVGTIPGAQFSLLHSFLYYDDLYETIEKSVEAFANFCYQCMDRQLQHRSRSRDLRRRPKAAIHGRRRPKPVIGQMPRRDRRQRRARRHSPHLGMRVKSTRLSNSSCGLSTSWKSDQNQSKVSEAGALEGVRFPLRTCVITIRLRDLRRCLCSLHDLSLLFSRSGRSIVASQPHTHTTTIPSHPLNERTHAMRP